MNQLEKELKNPIVPMAKPLYLLGKSSDNITHITGPNEKAKQAIKPIIPIKTNKLLI